MRRDRKSKRKMEDDDGRVIAKMNVDGMPWFVKGEADEENTTSKEPLTKDEGRIYMRGAILATIAIGSVFIVAAAILIVLMTCVWFK